MKALILAGGHATRLWPLTKDRAKPLLPLGGKPILGYILDGLEDIDEIDKIYVSTNEKFKDSFRDYLTSRSGDYELIIESQSREDEKYGAIGGIINVIEEREKDDYLVIGGDNYYSLDLKDFVNFSLEKEGVVNACYRVKSVEEAKNYGIVNFDEDQKIMEFQEKPESPKSKMASTACYLFPENLLGLFDEYMEYWKGKLPKSDYLDETGRFIEWVVERYDSYAYPFTGKWVDIGTRAGYLRAKREVRKGNVIEGETRNCEIGENVTILEGSEVEDSEVENSIIFEKCKIRNCRIKNTIVGENTDIENMEIRNGIAEELE